jgi:hypothetical protein
MRYGYAFGLLWKRRWSPPWKDPSFFVEKLEDLGVYGEWWAVGWHKNDIREVSLWLVYV